MREGSSGSSGRMYSSRRCEPCRRRAFLAAIREGLQKNEETAGEAEEAASKAEEAEKKLKEARDMLRVPMASPGV